MPADIFEAVWLVPLLPLASSFIVLLFGRKLAKPVINVLACGSVFVSFLLSAGIFRELAQLPAAERLKEVVLFTWLPSMPMVTGTGLPANFQVEWGYLIDPLSTVMILVVSGVGFLIHVYSIGYMAHEGGYYRYFGYLNLFMFMMLTLVLANNFLVMFVGWEGVGLCSYLLIGFWFLKKSASDAGKKAFIVNRVGDAGFLLGMFLIATTFGTLRFVDVNNALTAHAAVVGAPVLTAVALLLFVGATGKSAQIPLYVWLPDAMEGPTPVSALIHAATMVTAGVYMVARANAIYQLAPFAMEVVAGIGALTALYAASMGLVQNDIKRVLAYSTISQLGYMFLACGVGAFGAAVFHLSTHAYFKALLFLGSGAVIHALGGEQDIRKMGGLWSKLPVTGKTFAIGGLAIAGIFPLAGFFSKDEILWRTFTREGDLYFKLLWAVGLVTALMTAFYMSRLVFLTFFGKSRMTHEVEHHVHEAPNSMTVPLMILAGLSVVGGWVGWPAALGGSNPFEHFLEPVFGSHAAEHPHWQEWTLMALSIGVALAGIGLAYQFYLKHPELPGQFARRFAGLYQVVYNKYYVDEIYDTTLIRPIEAVSREGLWKILDIGVIDGILHSIGDVVTEAGRLARYLQAGFVRGYAAIILTGALILIGLFAYFSYLAMRS